MKEEDRGRRIATASGGRQWGRRLEFFCHRAPRHAVLDRDGEEDGAQLLVASVWRGVAGSSDATARRAWWHSGAQGEEEKEGTGREVLVAAPGGSR
jgi:hypothetical protein